MNMTIKIPNLRGKMVEVDVASLQYRPTVYGFVVHQGAFLSFISPVSGTQTLPGGKIEIGESAINALYRETQEEVGLDIEGNDFLYADDTLYFSEQKQQGYHMFVYYYVVRPKLKQGQVRFTAGAEIDATQWIPILNTPIEKFHPVSQPAMKIIMPLLQKYV